LPQEQQQMGTARDSSLPPILLAAQTARITLFEQELDRLSQLLHKHIPQLDTPTTRAGSPQQTKPPPSTRIDALWPTPLSEFTLEVLPTTTTTLAMTLRRLAMELDGMPLVPEHTHGWFTETFATARLADAADATGGGTVCAAVQDAFATAAASFLREARSTTAAMPQRNHTWDAFTPAANATVPLPRLSVVARVVASSSFGIVGTFPPPPLGFLPQVIGVVNVRELACGGQNASWHIIVPDPRPLAAVDTPILDGGDVVEWRSRPGGGLLLPGWLLSQAQMAAGPPATRAFCPQVPGALAMLLYAGIESPLSPPSPPTPTPPSEAEWL